MWQPQGFYNEYTLRTPVILSGRESVKGLYNYPASRIAVIHGSSFKDEDLFVSTFAKREIDFFRRSWKEEPDFEGLRGTIDAIEKFRPDVIIAVGGGSVIDGSKLCRLLLEYPCFDPKTSRVSGQMLKTRFIAIPTTVGSGAEVSSAAVYYDNVNHRKDMIVLHELQPEVVVYDPRYIVDTPVKLMCASALDAMTHILEGYVSTINNSYTDVLAEEGLLLLHEALDDIINKKDIDYQRLQYAGYIGGIVQNHCIVGAAHAIAHQLTEQGYSHGEAVSLLIPSVIRINSMNEMCKTKYEKISARAGFHGLDDMISFIEKVDDYIGLSNRRNRLKEWLSNAQEKQLFRDNVINDRGGKGNPVEITDEYIRQLIGSM